MAVFQWIKPSADQIAEAQAMADALGEALVWEGETLRVGQPDAEPAPPVPEVVNSRQARLVLLGAGLLDKVEQTLAAMPGAQGAAARIEWEYALEIRRISPLIAALAPLLGLTDDQVDDLFRAAGAL